MKAKGKGSRVPGAKGPRGTAKDAGSAEALRMQLRMLSRLEEIAGSSRDPSQILDQALDLVLDVTTSTAGAIFLADQAKRVLRFEVVEGEDTKGFAGTTLPFGEGIVGWVVKTGIPQLVNDARSGLGAGSYVPDKSDFHVSKALCVPLKIRQEVIGALEVVNKAGEADYTQEDLDICELFSSRISTLLESARAYEEVKDKAQRMETLVETTSLLSSTLDLTKLLELFMDLAKEVLEAEASSIFRIDEETRELYFEVATGERGQKAKEIRVPWGKGIVGAVAERGETVYVPDVSRDERWFPGVDRGSGFTTHSIIAVPLKVKGKIIGVAEVLNKSGGRNFPEEDVELFEAIAGEAAVAIENARLYQDLEELLTGAIRSVVQLIDAKDDYTAGHSARVTQYSLLIADEVGYAEEDRKRLRLAALLHDVGKIGMPDDILKKPGALTPEEFAVVKEHPGRGADAMRPIKQMAPMIPAIRHHHERLDGKGYPDGLGNGRVPRDAQIICVCDAYDAMTSDRPYRKGMPREVAFERLRKDANAQFAPELVEAFIRALSKREAEKQTAREA